MFFKKIAIDAEFAPNFIPGENALTSLIQISTHQKTYLIYFERIINYESFCLFWDLLQNNSILKLGQSLKNDLRNIISQIKLKEINLKNYVDIAELYMDLTGSKSPALDKICAEVFSFFIRKRTF